MNYGVIVANEVDTCLMSSSQRTAVSGQPSSVQDS
jgi:hypothetical protein